MSAPCLFLLLIFCGTGTTVRYTLSVDGKALEEFVDERKKTTKSWSVTLEGTKHLVAIGKGMRRLSAVHGVLSIDGRPDKTPRSTLAFLT